MAYKHVPMATYHPEALLQGDEPGAWSAPVPLSYTRRGVLLYALGIGLPGGPATPGASPDLRYVYEGHPDFAVFPTFAIRWGSLGLQLDPAALPPSPGPLMIDAERQLELLAPLPLEGTVQVRSRLLAAHPRGKGSAFVEVESEVHDADGRLCVRMVFGSFRRGVAALGDIEPFTGRGRTRSVKIEPPVRAPDLQLQAAIPTTQAMLYRLSGDYNPLHIDPEAARFGGFPRPILHGLCTYGHCGQLLLRALAGGDAARFTSLRLRFSAPVYPGDTLRILGWHDGPGRLVFEARTGTPGAADDTVVVNHAVFGWHEA